MNGIGGFDVSDNVVAIAVILLAMLVPIVAILSKHQLKMTALLRGQKSDQDLELMQEMRELKEMVLQQALTIDSIAQTQREITGRIGSLPVQDHLQSRF